MAQSLEHTSDTKTVSTASRNALLDQILPIVEPIIKQRLNHYVINANDREDVYQDIMLKMIKMADRFQLDQSTPLEHYVNKMIKSVKCDYVRRKVAQQKRQQLLINEYIVDYRTRRTRNPLERQLELQELQQLFSHLGALSQIERNVVECLLNDYKPREIAAQTALSDKTVYNAIQRSKLKLQKSMENYISERDA